ncbi:hypothetical protein NX059_008320 [Plenodomus lindquistii]|nr:hypothetical protein NX059_008320 [Plenodomus lindquistii]
MAAARLQALLACLTCMDLEPKAEIYPNEKLTLLSADEPHPLPKVTDDVVTTLLTTSLTGSALRMKLDSIVGARGWKQNVAKLVLEKLTRALNDAHEKLGPAVHNAYGKAWEVAKDIPGFIISHPVMCSIIALGVLVLLAPWVLEALGFAELGPVQGSFAAVWESTYGGLIPKGSLFSFFQRLGMVWGHPALLV